MTDAKGAYVMRRSYLVQRLKAPRTGRAATVSEVFAFGGGHKNGGLSDDAMGLLRQVFAFDYMGAAEFEFGAVPDALRLLAKQADDLRAFEFTIPLSDVPPNWRAKDEPAPARDAPIYILCAARDADEVVDRILIWATAEEHKQRLKESTHLARTLRPHSEWDGEVVGWFELDNGFFFFTDRDMWAATARLFGVEVPTSAKSDYPSPGGAA